MRHFTCFLILLCFVSCVDESDWATITIPPHQSFLLGERETNSFTAKVKNLSNNVVDFKIVNSQTQEKNSGFGISEKGEVSVFVSENETAIFINDHDNEVKIKVLLSKNVQGMRYTKQ
ncbi:MAG: hypothetical protein AAF617_08140 [Bacteroidota bacterium]